jgi:hypothetical protein
MSISDDLHDFAHDRALRAGSLALGTVGLQAEAGLEPMPVRGHVDVQSRPMWTVDTFVEG